MFGYIMLGFFCLVALVALYVLYRNVYALFLFKKGRNPYSRTCKRCGATQDVYDYGYRDTWEEVYPIGNNEKCKCHSYAN